jgi:hypothetical protein
MARESSVHRQKKYELLADLILSERSNRRVLALMLAVALEKLDAGIEPLPDLSGQRYPDGSIAT